MTIDHDPSAMVRSWLRETDGELPESLDYLHRVIPRLPSTPQQRHVWPPLPVPVTRRRAVHGTGVPHRVLVGPDVTRREHGPRTTARRSLMLTAFRTVAIVAAVAIGSVIYLGGLPSHVAQVGVSASPSAAQASAAAQSPSPSSPPGWAAVTGRNLCDYGAYPIIRCTEWASDPRVSGTATRTATLEPEASDQGALMWNDVTLVGPEGTWTGAGYGVMESDGTIHDVEIMSGSGTYEGLVYSTWGVIDPNGDATYAGIVQPGVLPPGFPVGQAAAPSPGTEGGTADGT
jgi:hypothetical protein